MLSRKKFKKFQKALKCFREVIEKKMSTKCWQYSSVNFDESIHKIKLFENIETVKVF